MSSCFQTLKFILARETVPSFLCLIEYCNFRVKIIVRCKVGLYNIALFWFRRKILVRNCPNLKLLILIDLGCFVSCCCRKKVLALLNLGMLSRMSLLVLMLATALEDFLKFRTLSFEFTKFRFNLRLARSKILIFL